MTTQAAREKLTEDVRDIIATALGLRNMSVREMSEAILSLIAERLADVTEEMDRAGEAVIPPAWPRRVDLAAAVFRAMLSASALPTRRGLTKNKDLP